MTPFGERVRQLRRERGRMLKDMVVNKFYSVSMYDTQTEIT